jgi:hypothetical protein
VKARVRSRFPSPQIFATAIVVLSYRIDSGTPPKKANAQTCPSRNAEPKMSWRLARIGFDEARVRLRQVHAKEVDLHPHPADDGDSLAKIDLRMSARAKW